jgi:hypothetical protein
MEISIIWIILEIYNNSINNYLSSVSIVNLKLHYYLLINPKNIILQPFITWNPNSMGQITQVIYYIKLMHLHNKIFFNLI